MSGDATERTLAELTQLRVRRRDGELHPTITYSDFQEVADYAWDNGMLLAVDIKVKESASAPTGLASFVTTVKAILESFPTAKLERLATVAIKVPSFDYQPFMNEVRNQIPDYNTRYRHRFQWALIANKSQESSTKPAVPDRIAEWAFEERLNLAFIETLIFSPDCPGCWEGKPFDWRVWSFDNLIDFAQKVHDRELPVPPLPKRPDGFRAALWSLDSTGGRGTLTRHYKWVHIGNKPGDVRGVIPTTMAYSGTRHSMITTDRFDVYEQILRPNWHRPGEYTEVLCVQ